MIQEIKQAFYCYLSATLIYAIQFLIYLLSSQVLTLMDFGGWIFYVTSCVSHAACIALIPFVLHCLFILIRTPKVGTVISCILASLICLVLVINGQVYQLYRFHINGFVLNMITGPAASEIFNFDLILYLKVVFLLLLIGTLFAGCWWFCTCRASHIALFAGKKVVSASLSVILLCTVFAHVYHIFASFYEKQSVVMSGKVLPYYFPTTSYRFLTETLHLDPPTHVNTDLSTGNTNMVYPLHPLETTQTDSVFPNIVIILVDSWNSRALTEECMPNTYQYAMDNSWFQNHVSCSNGTKSSVFGFWYGVSSYYWDMAESGHIAPVLLDMARQKGYKFYNYPSASQMDPPFGRVIFGKEGDIRIDTPGNSTLERDTQVTEDFIADFCQEQRLHEPFISFLFYDLPHSYQLPEEKTTTFTPSWKYADYTKLNNDIDPTPFWNLYRNTCYETDLLLGRVYDALEQSGLSDNTIVIVSGDHSQEFNENKKNYWGHNGNFSMAQIQVPLILHVPNRDAGIFTHRTTHYDVSPTLMQLAMGVTNPTSDYSMGYPLTDTQPRSWHIVGSDLNYGFIIEGDSILEKTAEGSLNVYDNHMNLVSGYQINAKAFNKAVLNLNRFLK